MATASMAPQCDPQSSDAAPKQHGDVAGLRGESGLVCKDQHQYQYMLILCFRLLSGDSRAEGCS